MNKFILSAIFASFVLITSSCTKQSNVDVIGQGNNGSGSTGGSTTNWNWSGTAPVSLKLDNVAFQGDAASTTVTVSQYVIAIASRSADHLSQVLLTIPTSGLAGHEYVMPTNASVAFQNLANPGLTSTSGKIKIVTNNATTVEGYFFASMLDQFGGANAIHPDITQGYFKVTKP